MTINRTIRSTALAGIALVALATAAGAEPVAVVEDDSRWTIRVAYDDLNLVSPSGREHLTSRVTAAVRRMCQVAYPDTLAMKLAAKRCYAASLSEANDQINRAIKQRSIEFASRPQAIEMAR